MTLLLRTLGERRGPRIKRRGSWARLDTAVVDVDGTLVDSSYHQVLAWSKAFIQVGIPIESCKLHRHMGIGGDRLVSEVSGPAVESRLGDELRQRWQRNYEELLPYIRPLDGAAELLEGLEARHLKVVIASSGHPHHTERAMRLLGLEDRFAVVDADDAEATKPAPDLVQAAMNKVSGTRGVMIGDTVWDIEAARGCGIPTIAACTGGIDEKVLRDAGAIVVASPRALLNRLDQALDLAASLGAPPPTTEHSRRTPTHKEASCPPTSST